jgi:hypothetical protein
MKRDFSHLKVGDQVTRLLAGKIPMKLEVIEIKPDRIIAGLWEFDPVTGAEIDDDLGWGPPPKVTGSFLKHELVETEGTA